MPLIACGRCGIHTRAGERSCAHCGAPIAGGSTASAAVLGLWLSATMISCSYNLYGITVVPDKGSESAATGDTGASAGTADTGATGDTGGDTGAAGGTGQ